MTWRYKRKIIPGGCQGVSDEIALSTQQVRMALNPDIPTRAMVETKKIPRGMTPNR